MAQQNEWLSWAEDKADLVSWMVFIKIFFQVVFLIIANFMWSSTHMISIFN